MAARTRTPGVADVLPQSGDTALQAKTMRLYELLVQTYGLRQHVPRREPMHELISTMLSHRTTHANEEAAYRRMWERFGSWEGIRDAPVDELTEAIKTSNFPEVKAPNIKKVLAHIIAERGEANIDFLADLPVREALDWLTSLPGVGVKTATLVLLFCFAKPVLPVDSHIHRISGRIGLIGRKVTEAQAHVQLLGLLPHDPPLLYTFHRDMLLHGQQICVWKDPRCYKCPMQEICDYYQTVRAPGTNGANAANAAQNGRGAPE